MLKYLFTLFIAFISLGYAQSSFNYKRDFNAILTKTKDPKDKWFYSKLISRFTKNDSSLTNADVLALMIGFTGREQYQPYTAPSKERIIVDLNAEGKYDQALEKADEYIMQQPLSIKILFERSFSYYKAHMEDSARKFSAQANMLFNAMKYSGGGKTTADPIFCLSLDDGQEYICKFLGSGVGLKGSQKDENANSVDFIEVVSKVQEPYNLFFMVQHIHNKLPTNHKDSGKRAEQKNKGK